ncbi:MAG: glycosyl transferase family 1 [Bacteroidetes bacterium]|nr:MAG: glycosyl transferase family 1 [Bacteroidota bacterium]
MPINVLVISKYTDYHSTRPEASIFHGLAKKGFQIYVMTRRDSAHAEEFEKSGIKVIDFHPTQKFARKESQFIRTFIKEHHIDILHLFNGKAIMNGLRAARGLDVKVVLYRGYAGNINWWDPTAYLKFLHPRADAIFCNSKGVEEYLRSKMLCKKEKAITINKGHDVSWYEGTRAANVHQLFNLPQDAFVLVNIANNRRMKGIPYLLKAMNNLPQEANIHLLLIGRDMDNKENRSILNQSPNAHKVHFPGFRDDVLEIVAGSDLFVLPSIKGESITKSVIESMSLETPALITDIPGNRELLEHNVSGVVVRAKNSDDLTHAILALSQDKARCQELGKNAKKYIAKRLNHVRTIQQTAALYQRLYAEKKAP